MFKAIFPRQLWINLVWNINRDNITAVLLQIGRQRCPIGCVAFHVLFILILITLISLKVRDKKLIQLKALPIINQ